jgi:hypothetical protein
LFHGNRDARVIPNRVPRFFFPGPRLRDGRRTPSGICFSPEPAENPNSSHKTTTQITARAEMDCDLAFKPPLIGAMYRRGTKMRAVSREAVFQNGTFVILLPAFA